MHDYCFLYMELLFLSVLVWKINFFIEKLQRTINLRFLDGTSPPNILLLAAFSSSFIDYMHKIECSQSIYANFLIICIKSSLVEL